VVVDGWTSRDVRSSFPSINIASDASPKDGVVNRYLSYVRETPLSLCLKLPLSLNLEY